jgi:hypothetical protein
MLTNNNLKQYNYEKTIQNRYFISFAAICSLNPDYTDWEVTVGVWEPWRGSLVPYGKPE